MRHGSALALSSLIVILTIATSTQAGTPPVYGEVTVTTIADTDASDGQCSLREAILASNAGASYRDCTYTGVDAPTYIRFAISGSGVQTINVNSRLPIFTRGVYVDGLSQSGADCSTWPPTLTIEISNPSHGDYNGMTLDSGSAYSTIRGLVINGFSSNQGVAYNFNAAINIRNSNGNKIQCNLIGTDATGMIAMPNLRGIDINSSSYNRIGSLGYVYPYHFRNLISGNTYGQIDTRGDAPSYNSIAGNFIGTDVTGTAAMSGQGAANGVEIGAASNGGTATGNYVGWNGNTDRDANLMRNVISGFSGSTYAGVSMYLNAADNQVSGNYIGTDVTGSAAIPNFYGVSLGSNASVQHNIIGNDGSQDLAKARNVISGNSFSGVAIDGFNGVGNNAVIGNYIGINAAGNANLPNADYGITLDYPAASTLIARNWIFGLSAAIRIFSSSSQTSPAAHFINNAGGSDPDLPSLDSSDNCVLGNVGVYVYTQGSPATDPNPFEYNWWGAATGPNTSGASSAGASIDADPWLAEPAAICDNDVIFFDGFELSS